MRKDLKIDFQQAAMTVLANPLVDLSHLLEQVGAVEKKNLGGGVGFVMKGILEHERCTLEIKLSLIRQHPDLISKYADCMRLLVEDKNPEVRIELAKSPFVGEGFTTRTMRILINDPNPDVRNALLLNPSDKVQEYVKKIRDELNENLEVLGFNPEQSSLS